ncbi:MAG: hypothetical protein ACK4ZH_03075 [Dolichospermum sp.]|nr:hypothetical protein [Dolichospermum circinale Clear-D4]
MIRLVFTDVLVPEKQIHEVITNVQAKLESQKCQFFKPVSGANRCIYRFPAANCHFPHISGSLGNKSSDFPQ